MNTLIGLPGPAGGAPPAARGARGHGAGSGLRRGQRDRAEAPPAVPSEAAVLRDAPPRTPPSRPRPTTSSRNIVSTVPATSRPRPGRRLLALARHAVRELAGGDSGRTVQEAGDRRRERRGRRDDRGPRGRRPLRALAVGAEHGARALVAARRPRTGQPILDPTPWVGGVKPFVMKTLLAVPHRGPERPRQRRLGARTSTRSRRSARSNSAVRTADADLHRPVVAEHARRELERRRRGDLVARERPRRSPTPPGCFAMQNLSGADASINCWNDKYYWDFWRPWNAIPRAAEDGNPATDARPHLDAAHHGAVPRAPVGPPLPRRVRTRASCGCSSATRSTGGFQITSSSTLPPAGRSPHAQLRQLLAGARRRSSRPASGPDCTTARRTCRGRLLGRNVADYLVANYFQPVGHAHGR